MSSEFEVQVTEEFEVAQATAETVRIEHGSPRKVPSVPSFAWQALAG